MNQAIFDILDQLDSYIYMTNPKTDEIVFVNKKMREKYDLHDSIGKTCWKVFQPQMTSRCHFCKVPQLIASNNQGRILWHKTNEQSNTLFDNCDFMIQIDGHHYHIHQSYEVENQLALYEKATYDELSGIYNHSTGKEKLYHLLTHNHSDFSVVLIDLNHTKKINEKYGRHEGDYVIHTCATLLSSLLDKDEFIYHYSGDKFIIVFQRLKASAHSLLMEAQKQINETCKNNKKPYHISFTYGLVEILQNKTIHMNELVSLVNERMYEEKLKLYRTETLEKKDSVIKTDYTFDDYFDPHINLMFEALTSSTDDFVYMSNLNTGYFRYSSAQVKYFNLPGELVHNVLSIWKNIIHPDDWQKFYLSNMQIVDRKTDYHSVEFRAKNANQEYVWLRCRGRVFSHDDEDPIFAGIITVMGRQNRIDPLTQIPNHAQFLKSLQQKVQSPLISTFSIMLIDIDEFKSINEIYLRDFGDYILKEVARLFQSVLPVTAELFRLEKDIFAVIYENSTSQDIENLYEDFCKILFKNYNERNIPINLSISAGSTCFPTHGDNHELLRQYCEIALQSAKENGKGQLCHFTPSLLTDKENKLKLIKQLKDSITHNFDRFELHYQPQVSTQERCVKGVEVLLRWKDPHGHPVSPMTFIPILEEYDCIQEVTLWILKKAIHDAKDWLEINPDLSISINISVLHILEDDFYQSIINIINDNDFPIQNLILEVTESTTAKNIHLLLDRLTHLQAQGLHIALDDFGTGYSSLNILRTAPFHIVKIDRTFVKNLESDDYNQTFIQFVTSIAHHVHMKVCLEGVEIMKELELVLPINLDYIQGYLFAKPLPANEIKPLLLKKNLF